MKSLGNQAGGTDRVPACRRAGRVSFLWLATVVGGIGVLGGNAVSPSGGNAASGAVVGVGGVNYPAQPYIDVYDQWAAGRLLTIERQRISDGAISYASGIRVNAEYFLYSGHATNSSSGQYIITRAFIGKDRNTATVLDVISQKNHESYGGSLGSGIDLGVGRVDGTIPGIDLTTTVRPASGVTVQAAGAGKVAIGGVDMGQDQWSRGWEMRSLSTVSSQFNSQFYGSASASGISSPVLGNAWEADSGGLSAVIRADFPGGVPTPSDYNVFGLITAQSGGTAAGTGTMVYVKLGEPSIDAWIQANTIPEPATSALLGTMAGYGLLRRRRDR